MPSDLDQGRAFEFDDLWRDVLLGQKPEGDSIFPLLDTQFAPLKAIKSDEGNGFFALQNIGSDLPPLELDNTEVENLDSAAGSAKQSQSTEASDELEDDLWSLFSGQETEPSLPKLFTWEDFNRKNVPGARRIALLSEAGTAAFNAALSSVNSGQISSGLLPQDYTLRACCNLVLGRSSSLFRWDEEEQQFMQNVDGVAVSGMSHSCSASLMQSFITSGSVLKKLRAFADHPTSKRSSHAALLALKSCVASVLNAVEEYATSNMSGICTFLQLQSLITPFNLLLLSLNTLVKASEHCRSDESLISAVSDHVHNVAETEHDLCLVFRSLLARVSAPWLEKLAQDVGLITSDTRSNDDSKVAEGGLRLVESADRELIKQTAADVDLLRALEPDHALLRGNQLDGDSAFTSVSANHRSLSMSKDAAALHTSDTSKLWDLQIHLNGEGAAQGLLEDMYATMSEDPASWADHAPDELYDQVVALGRGRPQETSHEIESLMADNSVSPFEQLRPLVQRQHRLVNGTLLRQLLKQHGLRQHLQLQRAFHLFGNADFVDRLSTALFSSDVQSAERRRDALPTGQIMGLRLGTTHEERWPPASSELRLTLTGILNETYSGTTRGKKSAQSGDTALPGGLSFSIRELPEHEIDRVLDPNSVYALDFLRLQYTAEAPLSAIITPDILNKYDDIFRFLLKLLRLIHITANFGRQIDDNGMSGPVRKFASHAHHVVSVLLSHVMTLGIDKPWATLMHHMQDLEGKLRREDAEGSIGTRVTCSMESLRQAHDTCLERIRTRLFLKRRQEKVRLVVEAVLASILKTAFLLQSDSSKDTSKVESQLKDFGEASSQVCTLLRDQIDRLPKMATDADFEDAEAHKVLLARINWNGYYF